MKNKSYKGFTLIELMIVVAILGILTAILLPFFGIGESKNSCSVYTPSNSYENVDRSTIQEYDDVITFSVYSGTVTVNKFNSDVVCNT